MPVYHWSSIMNHVCIILWRRVYINRVMRTFWIIIEHHTSQFCSLQWYRSTFVIMFLPCRKLQILTRASERKHSWAARLTPRWSQFHALQRLRDPNYHCTMCITFFNYKRKQPFQSQLYNMNNINNYADSTTKYVMTSKIHKQSSSWRQKVCHDGKKGVMMLKIRHNVKKFVVA